MQKPDFSAFTRTLRETAAEGQEPAQHVQPVPKPIPSTQGRRNPLDGILTPAGRLKRGRSGKSGKLEWDSTIGEPGDKPAGKPDSDELETLRNQLNEMYQEQAQRISATDFTRTEINKGIAAGMDSGQLLLLALYALSLTTRDTAPLALASKAMEGSPALEAYQQWRKKHA